MRCLSLKAGLSLLISAVLISTLFINVVIQAIHAGPRVRNEGESNSKLTRELVIMTIAGLHGAEDPVPALRLLYQSLGKLRHVDISIFGANEPAPALRAVTGLHSKEGVPNWFVELVGASPMVTLVPIVVKNREYGRIAIFTNPRDELAEVWSDIEWLAAISLVATTAILAFVIFLLRYLLSPFSLLRSGLADLETGKAAVRIPLRGAREFREISNALNSLAATLDRVRDENRTLVSKLIQVQDSERREIARDLHDDAGPALFSIRAAAVTLQELIAGRDNDGKKINQLCMTIDKASEALQGVFRDLLNRLRLKGLAELGLNEAVKILVESWREQRPEVELQLSMPHDCSGIDDALSSTAYRIVQEGLTNVFRHSGAHSVLVRAEFGCMSDAGDDSEEATTPALLVVVEDDGVGFPSNVIPGLGLLGMRERVETLGGALTVDDRDGKGTRLRAALPLQEDNEE